MDGLAEMCGISFYCVNVIEILLDRFRYGKNNTHTHTLDMVPNLTFDVPILNSVLLYTK